MAIVKWGFRRFYSSRKAVSEISELVAGSNAVTSKKPIRGKVTIAARKKMLESFVENYRAMNPGKFPTPSGAQKEVGGSYYTLKKMLQEMEYNLKVSSVEKDSVNDDTSKTITKESSSESQEVLDSQITMDQKFNEDRGLESVSNLEKNFDFKEGLQPSTSNADTGNINVTRDDNFAFKDLKSTAEIQNIISDIPEQHDETQNITSEIPEPQKDEDSEAEEHDEIQNITSEIPEPQKEESKAEKQHETQNIKSDVPEQQKDELKAEQKHDKIQNITSDMPNQQKDKKQHDEKQNIASDVPEPQKDELREKPSLWGNLKKLATGLINIWKK